MGWKIQYKDINGNLGGCKSIPEYKVRQVLPDAVVLDMKLGRYEGSKNETAYVKYTYQPEKKRK
jgi:hypothetical protein